MRAGPPPFVPLSLVLLGASARAEVSETATARQLAIQGIEAVESGDCDRGAPLLESAEKLHHASVHLQYLARCRLRAGRLVAATEMWRNILREGAPPNASPAVRAALTEATTQLERALPRLGGTTIRTAATYPDIQFSLDGAPLPAAIVGTPQVLDPGEHELVARAPGFRAWSQRWTITEGSSRELVVSLQPNSSAGPASAAPVQPGQSPSADGPSGASLLSTAGWITASAGAAAVVGGTVTFFMWTGRRQMLDDNCDGNECDPKKYSPSQFEDEKQAIQDLNLFSNVLLFGGGALVAGGITLIVLGADASPGGQETALVSGAAGAEAGLSLRGKW